MAEVIMKKIAKEKGLDMDVLSCGIAALPSNRIFGALADIFQEERDDYSQHRATQINENLVEWAEY